MCTRLKNNIHKIQYKLAIDTHRNDLTPCLCSGYVPSCGPASRVGTRSCPSTRPVAGRPCPSRATTHPPRAPPVAPTPGPSVQLAQTLGGGWGVVGAWRGLVGKGLLEALLPDKGPGAGCWGRDMLQGGGGGKRGVPKLAPHRTNGAELWGETKTRNRDRRKSQDKGKRR